MAKHSEKTEPSKPQGKRWLNISLRTLHLIGLVGLGGGYLYGVSETLWQNYFYLAITSGFALLIVECWGNPVFFIQLRGLVILLKMILLLALYLVPSYPAVILIVMIVISSVIAHAPGNLRYYSIYHRRRVDSL